MIKMPGMLLIGSAGRNVGKTRFACGIIKKFSKTNDITALKVTTITEKSGQCPRGGKGCGVCASLAGNFRITQETDRNTGKDTSQLLAAGAKRVYWLRCLKEYLEQGAAAIADIIGADCLSVCESNSMRLVAEPDIFLMLKQSDLEHYKSSAQTVLKYVDRGVSFDGRKFDLNPEQITLLDGKWQVPPAATAIIMAGGASSRFRTDKAMLPIKGRPMIEHICNQLKPHFEQILVSANDTSKYSFLGVDVVPDRIPGQGPIMGIASALEISANELNFVIACDIPQVDINFVKKMLAGAGNCDVVIPKTGPSKNEPLFAVYKKNVSSVMDEVLAKGGRKISEIFDRCKVDFIELNNAEWLTNLNTENEYKEYAQRCNDKI